jgi:hypothetical protein
VNTKVFNSVLAPVLTEAYKPLVQDWNQSLDRLCIGSCAFFGADHGQLTLAHK